MQSIQRSGKTFARYGLSFFNNQIYQAGEPILGSICKVLKDELPEMRASAMSCLATVSQVAPLTLLPVLYQVWDYFKNLLIFEKSVETRRAAIYNFSALVSGLDKSLFSTLPRDIIESLQGQLELISETDEDRLTRSHALTAIRQVDALFEDYIHST